MLVWARIAERPRAKSDSVACTLRPSARATSGTDMSSTYRNTIAARWSTGRCASASTTRPPDRFERPVPSGEVAFPDGASSLAAQTIEEPIAARDDQPADIDGLRGPRADLTYEHEIRLLHQLLGGSAIVSRQA